MARFLALVNIFVGSTIITQVMDTLAQFPNVEEIYEVTGESDIVTLISTANVDEFQNFLENKIFKIQGIRGLCYKELQEIGG